jgi:4-hydroxybenzoate polyprenyltransferase
MWLKNVVLLDVMMIALSFVTRAVAGVMALRPLEPDLEISPWLLVCTLFLALFLGFGKRRHELTLLEKEASGHRATLGEYTPVFLDQLIAIVTAATIIAYAIYTVAPETIAKFQTHQLVATVPFVAYGVFRYLFLIQRRGGGGSPSRALYRDPPLALAVAAWIVAVAMVLYAGGS